MPSPIAHGSLVLVVRARAERHAALRSALRGQPAFFYIAAVAALWAPDLDVLFRSLHDHPALRHGGATHSLAGGAVIGLVFALACRIRYGAQLPLVPVLGIGIGCAWTHAFMDMATCGGGVMLALPFSTERFTTAVPLFFGARHSQPTAWRLHLITLATELLFIISAVVGGAAVLAARCGGEAIVGSAFRRTWAG